MRSGLKVYFTSCGILYQFYLEFMCVASIYGHVYGRYQMKCNIYQGGYMSQIKYTAFIIFLNCFITELRCVVQY